MYFLKIWLRLTTFILQPTNGSLWKILNYTTFKKPRTESKGEKKRACPQEKKNMGLDFLGILYVSGLLMLGTDEKGPSRTLKQVLIQKGIQRDSCCT